MSVIISYSKGVSKLHKWQIWRPTSHLFRNCGSLKHEQTYITGSKWRFGTLWLSFYQPVGAPLVSFFNSGGRKYGVHHPPDIFCICLLLAVGWCTLAETFVSERIDIYTSWKNRSFRHNWNIQLPLPGSCFNSVHQAKGKEKVNKVLPVKGYWSWNVKRVGNFFC